MQDGDLVQKPESSAEESVTNGRDNESRTDGRSDTPVPRYRIHMRRNRGEKALYPRSTCPDSVNTEHQSRPKRTRRLPARLRSPNWVVSQAPVFEFCVNPKDVVVL